MLSVAEPKNPHATLVTLFMNSVQSVQLSAEATKLSQAVVQRVAEYVGVNYADYLLGGGINSSIIRFMQALSICKDYEKVWLRWANKADLASISTAASLKLKAKNTIVKLWPFRVSKDATEEEFRELLGTCASGSERYVEWARVET
jgi:hypothetical protein